MKYVMDRNTLEVIEIDENVERDWMHKFLHRSGVEFNGARQIEAPVYEEVDIEKLRDEYYTVFFKEVPVNKKNDAERIKEKIGLSSAGS